MEIIIHTGTLSVDNGAPFPLSQYFDLAAILEVPARTGVHYWDDRLEFPDEQWPLVKQLLEDGKLLFKVVGVDTQWQNVLTEDVRSLLHR